MSRVAGRFGEFHGIIIRVFLNAATLSRVPCTRQHPLRNNDSILERMRRSPFHWFAQISMGRRCGTPTLFLKARETTERSYIVYIVLIYKPCTRPLQPV
jgi:hypothetical protein